jgi:hypothetical protein
MARSSITSTSKDIITDDGSVLVSVIKGEQVRLNITLGWITNLAGYTILCKVVEGNNDGEGTKPTLAATSSPQITTLATIDTTTTDNIFDIVVPHDLCDNWDFQPLPGKPVYGFIGLQVSDTGSGSAQQIFKPFRGLVEVLYSPTEV